MLDAQVPPAPHACELSSWQVGSWGLFVGSEVDGAWVVKENPDGAELQGSVTSGTRAGPRLPLDCEVFLPEWPCLEWQESSAAREILLSLQLPM